MTFQEQDGTPIKSGKSIKETESGEQWKGSGCPVSATTKQIANDYELLVRSQEEGPGTQFSIIKIAT